MEADLSLAGDTNELSLSSVYVKILRILTFSKGDGSESALFSVSLSDTPPGVVADQGKTEGPNRRCLAIQRHETVQQFARSSRLLQAACGQGRKRDFTEKGADVSLQRPS
jgi:hypothetical protein